MPLLLNNYLLALLSATSGFYGLHCINSLPISPSSNSQLRNTNNSFRPNAQNLNQSNSQQSFIHRHSNNLLKGMLYFAIFCYFSVAFQLSHCEILLSLFFKEALYKSARPHLPFYAEAYKLFLNDYSGILVSAVVVLVTTRGYSFKKLVFWITLGLTVLFLIGLANLKDDLGSSDTVAGPRNYEGLPERQLELFGNHEEIVCNHEQSLIGNENEIHVDNEGVDKDKRRNEKERQGTAGNLSQENRGNSNEQLEREKKEGEDKNCEGFSLITVIFKGLCYCGALVLELAFDLGEPAFAYCNGILICEKQHYY